MTSGCFQKQVCLKETISEYEDAPQKKKVMTGLKATPQQKF
jgi:hypothetical protein